MKFWAKNIILPIVLGILASYIFTRFLIKATPQVSIYPSIMETEIDPHYFMVLINKEKEIIHLEANLLLVSKEINGNTYTISIPLWNDGNYPFTTKRKLAIPIKLHKSFFTEIQNQQGSYRFINEGLIAEVDTFVKSVSDKEEFDELDRNQKFEAKELFKKIFIAYGSIRAIITVDHKQTGLRKTISSAINKLERWD